jgi:hypothetical protein
LIPVARFAETLLEDCPRTPRQIPVERGADALPTVKPEPIKTIWVENEPEDVDRDWMFPNSPAPTFRSADPVACPETRQAQRIPVVKLAEAELAPDAVVLRRMPVERGALVVDNAVTDATNGIGMIIPTAEEEDTAEAEPDSTICVVSVLVSEALLTAAVPMMIWVFKEPVRADCPDVRLFRSTCVSKLAELVALAATVASTGLGTVKVTALALALLVEVPTRIICVVSVANRLVWYPPMWTEPPNKIWVVRSDAAVGKMTAVDANKVCVVKAADVVALPCAVVNSPAPTVTSALAEDTPCIVPTTALGIYKSPMQYADTVKLNLGTRRIWVDRLLAVAAHPAVAVPMMIWV